MAEPATTENSSHTLILQSIVVGIKLDLKYVSYYSTSNTS